MSQKEGERDDGVTKGEEMLSLDLHQCHVGESRGNGEGDER